MITVFETQIKHSMNWELILSIAILAFLAYTMMKKNQVASPLKILWLVPIVLLVLSVIGLIILIYVDIIKKINLSGIGIFIVTGLLAIACVGINFCIRELIIDKETSFSSYIPTVLFSTVALVLGCFSFASFQSNDLNVIKAYESYVDGEAKIIEGYVSEFTMAGEGYNRKVESFVVNGKEFFYLDDRNPTIYSTQKQSGGVIHGNGQYVKIWYYDLPDNPMILRIDILKHNK